MMTHVPISVVVITKDEEKNLKECLQSVSWADELVVVDDFSQDRTLAIARQFTDKVYQRKMDVEGTHRNWAYQKAQNEWVLSLDADERATPELAEEMRDTLTDGVRYDGFTIPRRNYIGDHWVRYGGWYPSPQLKLFKKDKFKYEEVEVHPRAFMDGPCGHLNADIIHYSYRDFNDFKKKQDNQINREATKWIKTGRRMSFLHALRRTVDRFFRSYLGKKGFMDGLVGFKVAVYASRYQMKSYMVYKTMAGRS